MTIAKRITFLISFFLLISCLSVSNKKMQDFSGKEDYGIRLYKVFDIAAEIEELKSGDGMSLYIETPSSTILFDTGYQDNSFDSIQYNMEMMNLDPMKLESVFISHQHYLLTLYGYLDHYPDSKVYLPMGWHLPSLDRMGTDYVVIDEISEEVSPGIYSTGSLICDDPYNSSAKDFYEQSMVIDTPQGLIVIIACSHPGIVSILDEVNRLFPNRPIAFLAGGFHLKRSTDEEITDIIGQLNEKDIQLISATHCTGGKGQEICREVFGKRYIEFNTGMAVEF